MAGPEELHEAGGGDPGFVEPIDTIALSLPYDLQSRVRALFATAREGSPVAVYDSLTDGLAVARIDVPPETGAPVTLWTASVAAEDGALRLGVHVQPRDTMAVSGCLRRCARYLVRREGILIRPNHTYERAYPATRPASSDGRNPGRSAIDLRLDLLDQTPVGQDPFCLGRPDAVSGQDYSGLARTVVTHFGRHILDDPVRAAITLISQAASR
ncbi:MAG TPA: hypothetical protein VLH84_01080 [Patescibacteria group bacterium]|nr:hypothetical protein [Patescibacteria group bacterium]